MTKTEFKTTVSEAEATLADLKKQLGATDDTEANLLASSEAIAYDAFTNVAGAKGKLEKLQDEIVSVQIKRRMLGAAITQAEAILAHARAVEADRIAREKATQARELASQLPAIGEAMDKGLDSFITGLKKIQEIHVALAQLEHPHPSSFKLYYLEYLQTVLWQAGIDLSLNYGPAPRGTTFGNILATQATYTKTKTADIFGDAEPVSEVEAETAPVVDRPVEGEPCMTWEKKSTALDTWDKRASKVHAIQH